MSRYFLNVILSFILSVAFWMQAQVYPTQITPILHPPYATTISQYANSLEDKISASIYTNDLSIENRQVQLKLYIEGNGINAVSSPVINGYTPIFINGGENLLLTNDDLSAYFQIENLTGIDPSQYGTSLPDGLYQFCFEVYDFQTQQKISQKSCASAYFLVNDPPMLNTPFNHENIVSQDPTNILFTWTPRHLNATNVEYEFTLVEILDEQTPTQNAFLYSQPIYQTTTSNTILQYGPAQPMLIEGRKYAWRVRAQVQEGVSEGAPFLNDGYSIIYDFTFAGNCPQPQFALANPISATQCEITWQTNSNFTSYVVQYRKLGTQDWFDVQAYTEQVMLYDLEAGETYEFRVGGSCYSDLITFSNINQFTQPIDPSPEGVNCGILPDISLDNQTPMSGPLGQGQVFMAGDFPIHVTTASGDGSYSGEGWTKAPYLGTLKLAVEYDNIKINTDMELIEGVVKTKYDPEWSNILSINDVIDTIEDGGDIITGQDDQNEIILDGIVIGSEENIQIIDGEIVITDENGDTVYTHDYDEGETYVITDSEGNTYVIDEDGNISQQGTGVGSITSATTDGVDADGAVTQLQDVGMKVTFAPIEEGSKKSQYHSDFGAGADYPELIKGLYKIIKDGQNNDYPLLYKAVPKKEDIEDSYDWVEASVEITDNSLVLDSLIFAMNGTNVEFEVLDASSAIKKLAVKLPAFNSAGKDEVLALLKTGGKKKVVGALMNVQIKEVGQVELVIVPVNNAAISPNLQEDLNAIYGGAGADFMVEIANNYNVSDTSMECGTSGWFTGYTDEQKTFINAYKSSVGVNNNKYYIFVMNGITPTGRSVAGYMPMKKQFGFIFSGQTSTTEENKSNQSNLIAHEIGHGVFELKHPWERFDYSDTNSGATDWLMDYGGGAKLPYIHWEQIGHPQFRLYWFQGDESGALEPYEQISDALLLEELPAGLEENVQGYVSFVSSAGKIISLPNDVKDLSFDENKSLSGFTQGNERYYVGVIAGSTPKKFYCYTLEYDDEFNHQTDMYKDTQSKLIDYSGDVYVYYLSETEGSTDSECGSYRLHKSKYVGNPPPNPGNYYGGYDKPMPENIDSSFDLSNNTYFELEKSLFNCLQNTDLKVFYKYLQYTFPERIGDINTLFESLNSIGCFKLKLTDDDSTTNCSNFSSDNIAEIAYELNGSEADFNYIYNTLSQFITSHQDNLGSYAIDLDLLYDGISLSDLFSANFMEEIDEIIKCITYSYTQADEYLLPTCIWQTNDFQLPYTITDLPFMIGLGEGAATLVTDLLSLVEALNDLENAYTRGLFPYKDIEGVVDEYQRVLTRLTNIFINVGIVTGAPIQLTPIVMEIANTEVVSNVINYVKYEAVDEAFDYASNKLVSFVKAIKEENPVLFDNLFAIYQMNDGSLKTEQEYQSIRDGMVQMLDFVDKLTSPNELESKQQVIQMINDELITMTQNVGGVDNIHRYHQGKIIGVIAAEIVIEIATTGTASAIELFSKGGKYMKKVAKLLRTSVPDAGNISDATRLLLKRKAKILTKLDELDGLTAIQKSHIEEWITDLDGNYTTLLNKIDNLTDNPTVLAQLADDIANPINGPPLKTFFETTPNGVKAWEALNDIGLDQAIRRNLTHLENVDGYFAKYPDRNLADLITTANQFDNAEDFLFILPDITQNSLVRGTRFDHFSNPAITNYNGNFSHAEYSFYLWKNNKWDKLEDFFTANNLNEGWPPNEGFKNIVNTETGAQLVGKKFDRFQGPGDISGGFASPVYPGEDIGDLFFTYDSRALKYDIAEGTQYIIFKVKSSVPSGLKFDYGEVIPWFGKQGLGDQVKSSMRFEDIKDHLEIIETKTYINGQWQ